MTAYIEVVAPAAKTGAGPPSLRRSGRRLKETGLRQRREGPNRHERGGKGICVGEEKTAPRLLAWDELPHWQRIGSELIHTGYRKTAGSLMDCVHSWTYWHNETVNIFSHLVGAFVFLVLPFILFPPPPHTEPPNPNTLTSLSLRLAHPFADTFARPITLYLLGTSLCFLLSTCFHTVSCHGSSDIYRAGLGADALGVLVLMWSSSVPLVEHAFAAAEQQQQHHHHHALNAALALAAAALAVADPRFNRPDSGPRRAALFGAFAAASFGLPLAHALLLGRGLQGGGETWLAWVGWTAAANALGWGLYGVRFPERWFPRTFDLCGASHQLMHVMVLVAAVTYTIAVMEAYKVQTGESSGFSDRTRSDGDRA